MTGSVKKRLKLIAALVSGLLTALLGYIVLHEGGHCLAAVCCGAEITSFQIFNAHMSYVGGTFTPLTGALLSAAGTMLPVSLSLIYIALYRRDNKAVFYSVFSFVLSLMSLFSLVPWIVFPVLYSMGRALPGEDVTKFIEISGAGPLAVCITGIILFAGTLLLIWKKGIVKNYWEAFRGMRAE